MNEEPCTHTHAVGSHPGVQEAEMCVGSCTVIYTCQDGETDGRARTYYMQEKIRVDVWMRVKVTSKDSAA